MKHMKFSLLVLLIFWLSIFLSCSNDTQGTSASDVKNNDDIWFAPDKDIDDSIEEIKTGQFYIDNSNQLLGGTDIVFTITENVTKYEPFIYLQIKIPKLSDNNNYEFKYIDFDIFVNNVDMYGLHDYDEKFTLDNENNEYICNIYFYREIKENDNVRICLRKGLLIGDNVESLDLSSLKVNLVGHGLSPSKGEYIYEKISNQEDQQLVKGFSKISLLRWMEKEEYLDNSHIKGTKKELAFFFSSEIATIIRDLTKATRKDSYYDADAMTIPDFAYKGNPLVNGEIQISGHGTIKIIDDTFYIPDNFYIPWWLR